MSDCLHIIIISLVKVSCTRLSSNCRYSYMTTDGRLFELTDILFGKTPPVVIGSVQCDAAMSDLWT